jgi:hypothetical protein
VDEDVVSVGKILVLLAYGGKESLVVGIQHSGIAGYVNGLMDEEEQRTQSWSAVNWYVPLP